MSYLTAKRLREENRRFHDSGGVSAKTRKTGFVPAFHDSETGRTELSRLPNGAPAPVHMLVALPDDWVVERDHDGHILAVKNSVIAGFLKNGKFYTREQAAQT